MYKGTNWTRGELGNVPDENPVLDCQGCGESFKWKQYWSYRVETPDDEFLCDPCHEERDRRERRRENNRALTEWVC